MAEIDVLTYGAAKSYTDKHGGGGGTSNYNALENKPQIGGNELVGNKTASDLGLVAAENGKSLSTNDYDNAEKQKNADNATAVSAIKGDIAPNFNATASYAVDDYVLKDGVLYKCTTAHTGAWDANDFTATTISDEITDVADAVDDIKDGTDIDSFGDVETALAGKQDTLTFDDVPTANSSNPVKSGGVYSALADKQDALTAGNYISIANDGTINVTQGIGVYDVYSYEIKSINSGYATKITKRKNGVFVSEQDISNGTYSSENRLNVDDRFEFWYTFAGYLWHYKLLVDSNEHQKDEEVSWEYSTLVDYTETFNVSQDSSTDLATKGDIEAAISSAYHHAGTKTCAELVAGLLVAGNEGNVYNMTDSGTTTADFIEGAGQPIKAGDNVGIAKISDGVYKFDLLSGFVDTTNFVQKSVTAGLLKNDGTVNDEIEEDVSKLKSGLTTLDTEVNGDATVYPYADVITIEDAVPANLADCSVKIEPVQDLHGYDKPWVGGAGDNKINIAAAEKQGTSSAITLTVSGDDINIDVDGSTYSGAYIELSSIANGNYYLSATYAITSSIACIQCFDSSNNKIYDSGQRTTNGTISDASLTVSDGYLKVILFASWGDGTGNVTYSNVMLATQSGLPYAPYTNICPITGHTEASVQRDGKNLCDKGEGNVYNGGKLIPVSAGDKIYCYGEWVSDNKSFYGAIFSTPTETSKGNKIAILDDFYTGVSKEMTISTNGYFGVCFDTSVESYTVSKMMISKTPITSASDYEPYAGKTYTIALGDTIYGGTVDFDSGVMTVDRSYQDMSAKTYYVVSGTTDTFATDSALNNVKAPESNDNVANIICTDYEVVARNSQVATSLSVNTNGRAIIKDARYDGYTKQAFQSAMSGVYSCYELATPTTIQLTPQQIQLLKGTNTLTASTGDISVTVNGVSGSIGAVQEQVNELGEDVALKQNATDNNLTTTSKTVVGGINELKSGLTNLGDRIQLTNNVLSGMDGGWYVVLNLDISWATGVQLWIEVVSGTHIYAVTQNTVILLGGSD